MIERGRGPAMSENTLALIDDLASRVEELEDAICAHMAAVDASRPLPVRAFDRELWRTVAPDGLTDWERRYGAC